MEGLMIKIQTRIEFLVSVKHYADAEMQRNILKALQNGMTKQRLEEAMDLHLSMKGGGGNEEAMWIKNLLHS